MSVSNPAIGITRYLTTSGLKQIYMKSTDETNYLEAEIDAMAFHDNIAGLGQEPDQTTTEFGGSQDWRDNSNAPFPGQGTYVTVINSTNASIGCNTLSTNTQTVRLVGQTILPIFDTSIGMWDDVVAASVAVGDLFITATNAQLKGFTNACTACTSVLPASTSSVTYYQPQLMSSDYYCVGSDGDALVPKIFIAWNIGTTYF